MVIVLTAIGSAILSIFSGVANVVATVVQTIILIAKTFFDWFRSLFDWFLKTAPRPLQLLVFLFLVLFILNTVIGTFLNLSFVCASNNDLKRPTNIINGVEIFFTRTFTDLTNSTLNWNNYLQNRTYESVIYDDKKSAENILRVECLNTNPRLTFFGIDILNYKYWVLILMIGGLLTLKNFLHL